MQKFSAYIYEVTHKQKYTYVLFGWVVILAQLGLKLCSMKVL